MDILKAKPWDSTTNITRNTVEKREIPVMNRTEGSNMFMKVDIQKKESYSVPKREILKSIWNRSEVKPVMNESLLNMVDESQIINHVANFPMNESCREII